MPKSNISSHCADFMVYRKAFQVALLSSPALSALPWTASSPGKKHLTEIRTYQQDSPLFTHLEPMKCGVVTNGEGYELKISVSGSHALGNARFARAACRKRNSTKRKQMYKAPSMRRESGVLAPSISASGENANSEPILLAQ